jgi:preprotein translocase subunit SecF
MDLFINSNVDFIRWRWHAIALSVVVVVAGVVTMAMRGGPALGIDFSGGTIVIVKFDQAQNEDAVRQALATVPGDKVVQQYGDRAGNEFLIRLPEVLDESGNNLERGQQQVQDALGKANIGKFDVIGTELVGAVIGADLQRKGIYATLASLLGIMLYIGFRFRFSFAVGAIVATLHDVLVTLSFLTFMHALGFPGYELSLNTVAALLTITGYSVNDTIVIFDRVRENFRFMRRDSLEHIVNTSVNQTLGRTIITAGTTFLAVLALYLFGGEVLKGFAFTMLVGIVSGTYSTVFIAAAIAILLSKGRGTAAANVPAAAAPVAGQKKRKARAS